MSDDLGVIPEIDFADDPDLILDVAQLPDPAVEKVAALRKLDSFHDASSAALHKRRQKLQDQRRDLQFDIQRLCDHVRLNGGSESEFRRIEALKKREEGLTASLVKLQRSTNPPNLPFHTLREFLKQHQRVTFVDARVPHGLAKGADPVAALAKARDAVEDAEKARTAAVRSAVPYDIALRQAYADIDALVERPEFARTMRVEKIARGLERQGQTRWPSKVVDTGGGLVELINAPGILAWAFGDTLKARAKAELDALYRGALSFDTLAEREAAVASATDALLAAERREEAIVELCEARRIEVYRRPKANPLAVLGIAAAGGKAK